MPKKILIINLKTYEQGTGRGAFKIAKIAREISKKTRKVRIMIAAQPMDVPLISDIIPTICQHMDPIEYGAHTGHILPEDVKYAGAVGVLINHSEDRMEIDKIEQTIFRARQNRLLSIACAPSISLAKTIATFKPDFLAIEPPELIGTKTSVSQAKPEIISKTVEIVRETNPRVRVLCGAGINTKEDVSKALELGAEGILVASAVVKSEDPRRAIMELLKGFG
ncbi:MAG TPA: triose-phosphate isomerase [Candidatus Aenigmarchaeota archaeon]|nr:triose-phosphate isomerase [Candidatus Aenigmarchaeota archaeon]